MGWEEAGRRDTEIDRGKDTQKVLITQREGSSIFLLFLSRKNIIPLKGKTVR